LALQPDQKIAHYRVIEKIGEGGMGEVYRAEDTKLGRSVALKILPEQFVQDETRLTRFSREAQLLASLNHPNIAAIHGLEEADGITALALELVEGETLAERIGRGPIPLEEAAPIALQIAEALEAAHEKGIIHRDLKPANIMFAADGRVKVLDFGLAKALDDGSHTDMTQSPTLSVQATQAGIILGTAAYMSPEQAAGKQADRRADIWAFGVVLAEMLTGRRTFQGESVSYVLAAVLKDEPDLDNLPVSVPNRIKRLLRRCLHKDPKQRLQAIGDARIELGEYLADPASFAGQHDGDGSAGGDPVATVAGSRLAWGTAAAILLASVLALWWSFALRPGLRPGTDPLPTLRFTVPAPDGHLIAHAYRHGLALSPDGKTLVFMAAIPADDETAEYLGFKSYGIWSRPLDQDRARLIPGTEGFGQPAFSPDGQWLAIVNFSGLKKVRVTGVGEPITLYQGDAGYGATWVDNDTIVFAGINGGLRRVAASGGQVEEITHLDETAVEFSHRLPHALPDGDTILFTTLTYTGITHPNNTRIEALSLATGQRKVLAEGAQDARYSSTGHLLLAREGGLLAAPFDPLSVMVTGPEVPILEGLVHAMYCGNTSRDTGAAQFAVAGSLLAFLPGSICPENKFTLVWVDREGNEETIGLEPGGYLGLRVSPDGRMLLAGNYYEPRAAVWTWDLDRKAARRQTFSGVPNFSIWGPGTDYLTYGWTDGGKISIVSKRVDSGPGEGEALAMGTESYQRPSSWSPDGEQLAFVRSSAATSSDIFILSRDGELEPYLETRYNEVHPDFSPDGNWIAYASNESGRREVYLRSYPDRGNAVQISTNGGASPVWSRKGDEVFYRTNDSEFFAVEIRIDGEAVKIGDPVKLFEAEYGSSNPVRSWDVAPDGRFLLSKGMDEDSREAQTREIFPDHIRLIQNWAKDLD